MIVIVDYGMGNLGSIRNMLKKIGAEAAISADPEMIRGAGMLILPGVGAFDMGMRRLQEAGLIPLLNWKVLEQKTTVLGICLGMQLLTRSSEEGQLPGLGWIDAETVRFRPPPGANLRVPHMGWNYVAPQSREAYWRELDRPRYYFVHSYHVRCRDPQHILATADHGGQFTAAICRENIIGTQFHPEKSHRFGMTFLRNLVGSIEHVSPARAALPAA